MCLEMSTDEVTIFYNYDISLKRTSPFFARIRKTL